MGERSRLVDSCRESTPREREWLIAATARRQDGLIHHQQLLALGLSQTQVQYRLRLHRLIRIYRGVYAVGHAAISRRARLRGASMIAADVALSFTSAGEWWEIGSLRSGPVQITCPRRVRQPGLIAHRHALPADELESDDGVLLTSVSRTLFDLASEGRQQFESAFRKAEMRHLTSQLSLSDLLDRYPRARGSVTVRTVLADKLYLRPTDSWLEDVFLPFLADRGFEIPATGVTIETPGGRYRVDCLWSAAGLIVELDGRESHDTNSGFEDDRARDGDLLAIGYRVLRITWRQLLYEPDLVERRLRAALATRVVVAAP